MSKEIYRCQKCNTELKRTRKNSKPFLCPTCGCTARMISKKLEARVMISASLGKIKETIEKNKKLIFINVIILVVTSVIGFLVIPIIGAVIGLIVGILAMLFIPPSITKIREKL